jgi:putative IMPACT (imprinted ancient) family translation regulator
VTLTLDYKQVQPLEYALKRLNGLIIKQDFTEQVKVVVQLPAEQLDNLRQAFPDNY